MQQDLHFMPQLIYQIQFETSTLQYGQKGWFLSIDSNRTTIKNQRSQNTCWIYLHKLADGIQKSNLKWRFIPLGQNTYKIIVADGLFKNHELYCFRDFSKDNRDGKSCYVFAASQNYNNKHNTWNIEKIANSIYTIQNKDTGFYLSSHRFYPNDSRDGNSTWVIGYSQKNHKTYWKIIQY